MTVTVRVAEGALRGRRTKTTSGGPLFSFKGVPYARPPVGALRFKPPQSPDSWLGTRDALEHGPICIQDDLLTRQIAGEEDCLYLNVYTPYLPSTSISLKPVMVWIHGGGFTHGSGNSEMYGVDYLIDADIVVVTINYRVGVLGFLSLNKEVPGNMGLKDQVAALQWVKKNISTFGGDPHNVTIFGESAGGASVHYLILSPLSKGLFHKAIAQSGSALNPWAFTLSNTARAFKLGEKLGYKTNDPNLLLKFLMKIEASKLVDQSLKLFHRSENINGLKFSFVPTVEPKLPGAFLCEHPLNAMRSGNFHKVPFITGFTSHEGIITLRDVRDQHWPELNSQLLTQLPEKLRSVSNSVPISTITAGIKRFYFKNKPVSKDRIAQYVDFQTDLNFIEGIFTTVKQILTQSPAPLYFYKFNFDGALGIVKQLVGTDMKGACHGDELGYLFRNDFVDMELEPTSPEIKTIKRMVSLWTNFAKSGNPTPALNNDIPVYWEPCTINQLCYLSIDENIKMNEFSEKNRMKFWEKIYRSKL